MCTIACDVFVQNHPKISCSREECFSLSVGLFYFTLFLVTHPPSPFLPSAPVLFSVSLCVSQRFMDDLCFRAKSSENLLLTRRVFLTFRRLISLYSKLRTLLRRSCLRRPYYSRSACVLQRLARRVFLTFRRHIYFALFGLRTLLHRSCLRRPYYSRSPCVCRSGLWMTYVFV